MFRGEIGKGGLRPARSPFEIDFVTSKILIIERIVVILHLTHIDEFSRVIKT